MYGTKGGTSRERLAVGLLVASGAVFMPGALNRFVFPKLALAALAVAFALTGPARGRLPRSATIALGLAAALLVLAALAGEAPVAALIGRPPRYEGAAALPIYLGALVAGARVLGPERSPASGRMLLDALALAALAIGVIAVLEAAGLRPLESDVARPGSLLGNASDQGAWALLALGPLAAASLRGRPDPLHLAGVLAAGAALVTSGSRGALAGALVVALILAATAPRTGRLLVVAGVAAIAVGVVSLPSARDRITGSSPLAAHTSNGRLLLWGETARMVADNPLLGEGPSGFVDAIGVYHSRTYERDVGPNSPPDSPHNWVLQAASAGGIPLAVIALVLAALTVASGARAAARRDGDELAAGMLAGVGGYAIAALFYFTTPGSTPLAALYAGALLALRPRGRPARARVRTGVAAAYVALGVVLALAAVAELPLRSALALAAQRNVPGADHDFHTAEDLRPWDPGVAQTATHAFAVLAQDSVPGAADAGLPWVRKELSAWPDSIQGLTDAASLETAAGRLGSARALLARARRLEPNDPLLRGQP